MKKIEKWDACDVIMSGDVLGYDSSGVYRSDGAGSLILYEWPGKGMRPFDKEFHNLCLSLVGLLKSYRLKPFILTSDIWNALGGEYDSGLCDLLNAAIADALQHSYLKIRSLDAGRSYSEGRDLLLNRNWICAPCHWICPVCEREKKDLLFQDSHGVWRGELVVHHDHCTDEFGDFLDDYDISFKNILLCSKCNTLEGIPKANGLVEKWFSYDWWQIKKFSILNEDGSLAIDMGQALEIYDDCAPLKKELIDHALILHKKRVACSGSLGATNKEVKRSQHVVDSCDNRFRNIAEAIYLDLNAAAGFGAMYPVPSRKTFKWPSATEISFAIESYNAFANTGDDIYSWRCNCCERSAEDCVRFYPKNRKYKFRTSFIRFEDGTADLCLDCAVSVDVIIKRNRKLDKNIIYHSCCKLVEVRKNQPSFFDEGKILKLVYEVLEVHAPRSSEYIFNFDC